MGVTLPLADITPENVASNWKHIADFDKSTHPTDNMEIMHYIRGNIESVNKLKNPTSQKTAETAPRSVEIFDMMAQFLADGHGKDIVPKV